MLRWGSRGERETVHGSLGMAAELWFIMGPSVFCNESMMHSIFADLGCFVTRALKHDMAWHLADSAASCLGHAR